MHVSNVILAWPWLSLTLYIHAKRVEWVRRQMESDSGEWQREGPTSWVGPILFVTARGLNIADSCEVKCIPQGRDMG